MRLAILVVTLTTLALASFAQAQTDAAEAPRATLVADSLQLDAEGRLVADGAVEVLFEGARLTASRIVFDPGLDRLRIDGPIRLEDPAGNIVVAEAAALDPRLTDGLLTSARFVLDRQLQLAAAEIERDGGRFTRLRRVTASSCEICEGETPLWEIRAAGVVHDQTERQLYFTDAQFRVGGVPVFYVPRLRLPDPTLDRATGFLIPAVRSTNQLGTGLKLPYFVRINDRSDFRITPYLSSATTTLEARYRLVFRDGSLAVTGAYTESDDILGGRDRGYAILRGDYLLPRDYRLSFDAEFVTDRGYGLEYGYFDRDRLDSKVEISRVVRDGTMRASLTYYETLREADIGLEDTIPRNVGEFAWSQRIPATPLAGDLWVGVDAISLTRPSSIDGEGRDVSRIGARLDWRDDWVVGPGMIVTADAGARIDAWSVRDDSAFVSEPVRTSARTALTLRWPLEKQTPNGARQILEPVIQLGWSHVDGDTAPNEDSLLVEFDEGNLLAPSRYPGVDRTEDGGRASLGFAWRRLGPSGIRIGVTAGRILRFDPSTDFAAGSGLQGDTSDWLAAVSLRRDDRFSLINRALIDDDLEFTRNETRADIIASWGGLSTSYIWALPVPDEGRDSRLSEWSLDTNYAFTRNWRGQVSWRYDFAANRAASAGLGLSYTNECVNVDLSLSRRFTSSDTVSPTTDFDISVSLSGFGAGTGQRAVRRGCGG